VLRSHRRLQGGRDLRRKARYNQSMTLRDALKELESLADAKVRAHNTKFGAGDKQYGVKLGDIRKIAAKIKTEHSLALALWETGIADAQLLAILILDIRKIHLEDLDRMVRSVCFSQVADWLDAYVTKKHPDKETLRQRWMADSDRWAARAGWSLTSSRIGKSPEGLDLPGLLDRIETEMPTAPAEVQWTMNFCLAGIGIHFPEQRERAIEIGERLGICRDYPVSKGCTSPFAPIWIREMVRRQG
jgi:3-methyladenine DNA glycosylase AlkD